MDLSLDLSLPTAAIKGGGGGPSYDADASALFVRMSVPPDDARKGVINTLIVGLKAAGIWTVLDAIWLIAAHDAQAARLNWKGDVNNISAVNSPTFTVDRGYAGDGASSYLFLNFDPSANGGVLVLDSAHFAVWNRTNNTNTGPGVITTSSTRRLQTSPRSAANEIGWATNGGNVLSTSTGGSITTAVGMTLGNRTGSTATQVDRNGVQIGSSTDVSTGLPVFSPTLGALNNNGSPGNFSSREWAFASLGAGLTPQQRQDYYTLIAAYMTAVGA